MTDWKGIHPDFTDELQEEWEEFGFEFLKVKGWIEIGLKPEEASFAFYIKDFYIDGEGYGVSDIKERLDELRKQFFNEDEGEDEEEEDYSREPKRRKVEFSEEDWVRVDSNFTPELIQKWKDYGFDWEEAKDWISSGMKADDADFCAWLRDEVKVDSDWVLNYECIEDLQEQHEEYLLVNQQVQNTLN